MLKSLTIKNFKCFESLQVDDLKPVNVIVGLNNSGKTTLLEAIHFLTAGDLSSSLWESIGRRGLYQRRTPQSQFTLFAPDELGTHEVRETEYDVSALFQAFKLAEDHEISILGIAEFASGEIAAGNIFPDKDTELSCSIGFRAGMRLDQAATPENSTSFIPGPGIHVKLAFQPGKSIGHSIRLSTSFGLDLRAIPRSVLQDRRPLRVRFIPTQSVTSATLASWFSDVQAASLEDQVAELLRVIAPTIKRVTFAPVARSEFGYPKSAISAHLFGSDRRPVPLASMGEGMWRLLSLALGVTGENQASALIDEIDTGLHYTVLPDMWRMVSKTAIDRGVQVFATTHSKDCLEGLVRAAETDDGLNDLVSVIRLDPSADRASVISLRDYQYVHEFRGYPIVDDGGESRRRMEAAVKKYSGASTK